MDEIVKQAMAKWPNVPHCYGWLALDARGNWRIRDERSQTMNLVGDKITHPALRDFINRNYQSDAQGQWYFQNGPQRVYVNLEAAPYIARTDPLHGFVLHTGEPLATLDAAWLIETGQLLLQSGKKIAFVDDRDTIQCLPLLRTAEGIADDTHLLAWLNQQADATPLLLQYASKHLPLQCIERKTIPDRFGFVPTPRPDGY